MIGGTDPSMIPITDEVSPNKGFKFFYRETLCIVPVVEKLTLQSCPHAFTAGIVMASASCTVHTLADAVFQDGFAINFTRIL